MNMPLTNTKLSQAAQSLLRAAKTRIPIDPLTDTYPGITIEQAYGVQLNAMEKLLAEGRKVVGKKIGLTSPPMQQFLNVSEPDYGHLLDDMLIYQGEEIPMSRLLQPRIEGEIAFILERDLLGPGVNPMDVIRVTAGVTAALEIIDSRVRDWKIKIQDTVADNASSGVFVLGSKLIPLLGLDLRHVGFVMTKNGQLVSTGAGAAVLGDPVQAVAWLANKMGEYGISLKAGEIILSGSAAAALPVQSGDVFHLTVDRLGDVGTVFK
jgi:2-keto-4-pentenoate hydratase